MANSLMFEVGVKEAGTQLTDLEKRLKNIVSTYGKLELKVQVDGLKAFMSALENIGQSKGLDALQNRIDVLQVTLANVGMSGAKSIQEFEAAVKVTSAVAEQYTRRINEMTAARDKFANGSTQWMALNSKLTDYQNDKQVLAIYAQEQVAIKNLEEAKTRLGNTNNQEAESYQKVITSIETLNAAANTLKATLGTWDSSKGSIAQLVEQFEKLKNEISTIATTLKGIDPSKLNLSGLNINVGSIAGIGDLNSAIRGLKVSINDIIKLFSNLVNAVKLQPVDEQVKALLDRCEKAETKLREVGDAAKYLNERAGAKTQQKASTIAGVAGVDEEVTKVTNTMERYLRLLFEVENQASKIGRIQLTGETFGIDPVILRKAQTQLEGLIKTLRDAYTVNEKGEPILKLSPSEITKMSSAFSAFKAQYRDIVSEADKFNKANEKLAKQNEKKDENFAKQLANDTERATKKVAELQVKIDQYKDTVSKAQLVNAPTGQLQQYINYLQAIINKLNEIRANNGLTNTGQTIKEILNGSFGAKMVKGNYEERLVKDIIREMTKYQGKNFNPVMDALNEYKKVVNEITALQKTGKTAEKFGIDITDINNKIAALERYRQELEEIAAGRGQRTAAELRLDKDYQNAVAAGNAANAVAKNTIEKEKNAQATTQLSSAEQQLANAIKGSTDSMHNQSQVLGDLKMMATQYLSVWGAQNFVNNIIEIGGQLEMQRLSIGAILQDTEHANDLFEKIKTQALKSPFGVVELDAMTKQLSAYGFQYNELFDMTKRLADISAATGTGVDRLALALGHVRSEAALSGYTLRQFSMANIPLAKKLSEHLSEVEKRFVSVAEVRKRVRTKDIGYEDVLKVLKDLTNEGGMFYNAQEIMSQSVKARFKNLKDAFDIMYGEIAESAVGDSLKELASMLTVLAKNWKAFIPLIESGVMAFAAYKLSVLATNAALGANGAAVMKNILSYKQKQAVELQNAALVRKLTVEEENLIRTRNVLTAANVKVAMSTGNLTRADALRMVGLRKISLEESKALVRMGLLSAAEVRAARAGSIMGLQMGKLGNQIKFLGASAAAGVASLAKMFVNPWTLGFAAMSAGMSMWQNYKQRQEDMRDYVDAIRNRSTEGTKNLAGTIAKMSNVDVNKASADDLKMAIEDIIDKLKDYDPSWQLSLKEAFSDEQTGKVRSQADQFVRLRDALNETAEAYEYLKRTKNAFMNADDKSGGKWYELQERFSTNINEYNDTFDKYGKAASELAGHIDEVEEALARAISADKEFANAASGKTMREQIDILMRNWHDYGDGTNFGSAKSAFEQSLNGNGIINGLMEAASRMDNLNRAWWSLRASAERFKEQLYKDLVTDGGYPKDPSQWSKAQNDNVLMQYKAFFDQFAKNVPENMRSDIMQMMNELRTDITGGSPWRIPIVFGVGEPEKPLEGWRADMQKWLDDHNLTFTITAEMSLEDIKKGIHGKMKEAQEIVDDSGGVLIKVGLDTSNLPSSLPQALQTPWYQYNFDRYNTNNTSLTGFKNFLDTYHIPQPKDKNKNKGSQEDKDAKELRERMRILKEAADAYKYWRDKVGEEGAEAHVNEEFGEVLSKLGYQFKDVQQLRKTIQSELKKYQDIYDKSGKKRPQLLEAIKEGFKTDAGLIRNDFEKNTERFLSKTQIELDNLTRSWETFNAVRDATGNIELAVQLSGAQYANGKTQNLADAIREKIQKDFASVGAIPIPFDINLSDEQIGDAIKAAMPKASEEQIKGFVEEYKKWRDLQRDVEQKDVETFKTLIGSAVDLQSELRKISDEYLKIVQSLDRMKAKGQISGSQYNQAKAVADANLQMKTVQAQNEYKFLMDGVVTLSKKAAQSIKNDYVNALQKQLKAGAITAKDYADKIQEINAKMKQLEDVPSYFRSYTQGGFQGLFENMMNRGKSLTEQGAAMFQQGAKEMQSIKIGDKTYQMSNFSKMMQGNQMSQMGADMMQGAQGAMSAMSTIDTIIHGINDAVQSMKGIFDEVREMFDALGHDVESDSWQDANTFFSSFSKASQNATEGWDSLKNGNIGGAIQGTVGSITSWITGFAQGHDAKREKHIQDLKREVERIGNTLDLIKSIREDTLGYDKGNLRREMTEYYNSQQAFKDVNTYFGRETMNLNASATAMKEYYSRGGIEGNGYKQELEALKKQREDYQKMWEEEDDKKKSSAEALEEYKAKMSELDLSIRNFSKTIAEELFGIDLKGWADQIGDALMTAFENGEDAAEAFNDTVQDIMRQVLRRMLNLGIIEPMMERLQKRLFGENGQGGVFDPTNPEGTIDAAMRDIAEFFGEGGDGQKMIEASETFYKRWQSFMESQGLTLESGESSSSTVGGGIKSITEQTADLLAGYINSIRADVSENRNMIAQYFPMFYQTITSSNSSLTNIQSHTEAIMRSNQIVADRITSLDNNINGLKNKAWKVPMA